MSDATTRVPITRFPAGPADDVVVVEEPLEIRVGDKPVSITMRTPDHDFELAAGFLFTEGILHAPEEIESIRHWGSPNVVRVGLREGTRLDLQRLQRHFYAASSCGVCGKTSIDSLRVNSAMVESDLRLSSGAIAAVPDLVHQQQAAFAATGGIHAAALIDATGRVLCTREDVGRHNAVDKVIGSRFLAGDLPLRQHLLFTSGRASFEIVQKTVAAGIPILAAVGAASSLAVDLAREFNLTLIGFLRDGRFNVYCGEERVG